MIMEINKIDSALESRLNAVILISALKRQSSWRIATGPGCNPPILGDLRLQVPPYCLSGFPPRPCPLQSVTARVGTSETSRSRLERR